MVAKREAGGTAVVEANAPKVAHPSVAERVAIGKEARRLVPRSSHAELTVDGTRPDPVALLERQAATRVPELVPIRYGRMLVSPFTFYRGAALVMAADLPRTPAVRACACSCCGDAHLIELRRLRARRSAGWCSTSTTSTRPLPGPVGVGRQAAGGQLRDRRARATGYSTKQRRRSRARACRRLPRRDDASSPAMTNLDVWYARLDIDELLAELRGSVSSARRASRPRRTSPRPAPATASQALAKLTEVVDGQRASSATRR